METLRQQIRGLLAQDIMLEQSFKAEVIARLDQLAPQQLTNIVNTLQTLVNTEKEVLARTVENQPYFFQELQHKILNIMHQEFLKQEATLQQQADITLKQSLQNL